MNTLQVRLAELGSTDAVWLVATMLDHLVKGEVMQATMTDQALLDFDKYLQKSFYKTGSLFAHSAKVRACGQKKSLCSCAWVRVPTLTLALTLTQP